MEIRGEFIIGFLLILLRISIVFSLLPFFGSKILPRQIKIGLILALSVVLAYTVHIHVSIDDLPLILFTEIIIGITLGLIARMVFLATEMAGQLMSNMIGLSIANFYDPEMGQSTELSRVFGILAMISFFSLNVHHDIIALFVRSYDLIPFGGVNLQSVLRRFLEVLGSLTILCFRIAIPVVVMMMLTNIAMGFISRAVPQMNIFFVAYPVYFFLGFLTLTLSLPAYFYLFGFSFDLLKKELIKTIEVIGV